MNNKQAKLRIIAFALLLLGLFSVSYGFFNYTKTGVANTLSTGTINFSTIHGEALNMTNMFPMTSVEAGEANLDTVTLEISGDTTYANGEEFEITLVDVTNTVNGKQVPINFIATYEATTGATIGNDDGNDYWEDREDKDSNIYVLNATGDVVEGKQVLVGYIKSGGNGVHGTLTISAYIDASRIAITDTYYRNTPTPNPLATPSPTPTGSPSPTATPGPSDEYGTTDEWVNGRTVFTTSEWNSLENNPISFKIKAESNEGIWVEEPAGAPTMEEMCPDCVFTYTTTSLWTTWNTNSQTPSVLTSSDYEENYEDVIIGSGKNFFLGLKLNGSNQIEKAYACGLYNGTTPFCIEGYYDDSKYEANQEILQNEYLWNNTCLLGNFMFCEVSSGGLVMAHDYSDGRVMVGADNYGGQCIVYSSGLVDCDDGSFG